MSSMLKCLLALVVVLCFMQFVEMARIPREIDPAKIGADISRDFDTLVEKLKASFDEEKLKEFMATASHMFTEGAKKVQTQISEQLAPK